MSAVKEFLVPDLGEGLEDATITGWNVAVGDEVELNQTLCTVETNKAEVEIPSPYAGRIVELGGAEGETLTVGSVLVRIATSVAETAGRAGNSATEPVAPPPSASGTVRKPVLVGYGADDDMDTSRRGSVGERPRAKPPVRKLAAELNVDLTRLTGSGPDGLITREDVLAAAGRSAPTPEMVAVRGVQAEMAHRMTLSRRQIPDAHAGVQVDCSSLIRMRDRVRDIADDESPITPFVLTLRLLTIALRHHPNLNSTWLDTTDGPQIHVHSAVHLGFGVAAPRGLLGACRQRCAWQDHSGVGGRGHAAHPRRAGRHAQTVGTAGLDVHGVQLRRAGVGRGRAGDQLSGGGHSRHGFPQVAAGGRRRRSRRAADNVTDVCLRPPHRRWRCGGGVPA